MPLNPISLQICMKKNVHCCKHQIVSQEMIGSLILLVYQARFQAILVAK